MEQTQDRSRPCDMAGIALSSRPHSTFGTNKHASAALTCLSRLPRLSRLQNKHTNCPQSQNRHSRACRGCPGFKTNTQTVHNHKTGTHVLVAAVQESDVHYVGIGGHLQLRNTKEEEGANQLDMLRAVGLGGLALLPGGGRAVRQEGRRPAFVPCNAWVLRKANLCATSVCSTALFSARHPQACTAPAQWPSPSRCRRG